MKIGRARVALLLTACTDLGGLFKGWNPLFAVGARKVNEKIGLCVRIMRTRRAIIFDVGVGVSFRIAGVGILGVLCGQMLEPRTPLKKLGLVKAMRTLKRKVLVVNALDMVIHGVLVNFPNVAMRTYIQTRVVARVLAGARQSRSRNPRRRNLRRRSRNRRCRRRNNGRHMKYVVARLGCS